MIQAFESIALARPADSREILGGSLTQGLRSYAKAVQKLLRTSAEKFQLQHHAETYTWSDGLVRRFLPTDVVIYVVHRLQGVPAPEIDDILSERRAHYVLILSALRPEREECKKFSMPLRGKWNGTLYEPIVEDRERTNASLHIHSIDEFDREQAHILLTNVLLQKQATERLN